MKRVIPLVIAAGEIIAAEPPRVILDGWFDDWSGVPAAADPLGDVPGNGAGVDFVSFRGLHDEHSLLLEFSVAQPFLLQGNANRGNTVTLYLDTDLNPATGLAEGELGAELVWTFGQRQGFFHSQAGLFEFTVHDFGIRAAPTFVSARFEVAIPRELDLFGQKIFATNAVRASLRGNRSAGDRIPDSGGMFVAFTNAPSALPVIPVEKVPGSTIRVATWNTYLSGPNDANRQDQFRRVLRAIGPEILVLQEMWGSSRPATRELITNWLGDSPSWHVVPNASTLDSVILSRHGVVAWWNFGNVEATAALLDTRERIGTELLLVAAHLSCCDNDPARDIEVNALASFLQDAREPGGRLTLAPRTPIILLGDLNLVGKAEQLTTLMQGRLVQGARQAPDWDETPLADLLPRHTAAPDTYTWRVNVTGGRHGPSRLDYMLYSDSVVTPVRQFVLQTETLPETMLTALDLRADDIYVASDHAPVVADFAPAAPVLRWSRETGPLEVRSYAAPGQIVEFQSSADLRTWEKVGTPLLPVDPRSETRRFYRAITK